MVETSPLGQARERHDASPRLIRPTSLAAVVLLLAAVYAIVFAVSEHHVGAGNILLWSACNAVPQVLLAVPLVDRLPHLISAMNRRRAVGTAVVAICAYAAVAYGAVVFLLALTERVPVDGALVVNFFSGPGLVWQIFQSLAYGLIALLFGLWQASARDLAAVRAMASERTLQKAAPPPARWLVKTADGIVPVDPADLVRIEAAGEYCRLVLPGRAALARISMSECEDRLRDHAFLRAHRSHLVNTDRLVTAEPAGNGRLQLTLDNGDSVLTSRQGAQAFRAVAV